MNQPLTDPGLEGMAAPVPTDHARQCADALGPHLYSEKTRTQLTPLYESSLDELAAIIRPIIAAAVAEETRELRAKLDRCNAAGKRIGKLVEVRETELIEDAVKRVVEELGWKRAAYKSICTMFGWLNCPPLRCIEGEISAMKAREAKLLAERDAARAENKRLVDQLSERRAR
jgi:hypothetical protein